MNAFRALLLALIVIIVVYTVITVASHGIDFFTPFFSRLAVFDWQGQFNLDFGSFILLTGVWIAWRGGFTTGSIVFGATAPVLGMPFLASYLLWLSFRTGGDPAQMLLGVHAGDRRT